MKKQVTALLAGVLAVGLAGCGAQEEAAVLDPTVHVEVTSVQVGSMTSEGTYIGTISAEGTATVVAQVSGTVLEVPVSAGDTVSAGDLLCRFDDAGARLTLDNARVGYSTALAGLSSAQAGYKTAQAALGSAEAGRQNAQAGAESAQNSYDGAAASYGITEDGTLSLLEDQLRLTRDNYEDTKALFEIGAASQIEVDQAEASVKSVEASLAAAQANLAAAQAGMQQAQAGIASAEAGMAQAEAGVESAQAGMQQARAGVEQARVGVESAEYQLTFYHVTAPISGVVEAVNVTPNSFAQAGTVAAVISNAHNKTVTFYVTDAVRSTLQRGQAVTVTHGDRTYPGAVTEVSGVVDAYTGLFQVKAVIDGAQDLPDGLAVEISTVTHAVSGQLLVPANALYYDDGDAYVYVARDGAAVRTPVTVSLYTREQAALAQGLSAGDQVITSWSAALKDGAPIQPAGQAE